MIRFKSSDSAGWAISSSSPLRVNLKEAALSPSFRDARFAQMKRATLSWWRTQGG